MIIAIRQTTVYGPTFTVPAAAEATDGASLGRNSSNGAAKVRPSFMITPSHLKPSSASQLWNGFLSPWSVFLSCP